MSTVLVDGDEIEIGGSYWKDSVLDSMPFYGDYSDAVTLTDKVVLARTSKKLCSGCLSVCQPNTYNRIMSEKVEGTLMNFRFCQDCCTSQAFEIYKDCDGNIVDVEDEEAWDNACFEVRPNEWEEPKDASLIQEELRAENEKYLRSKLGKEYDKAPDFVLYETMLAKGN